MNDFGIQFVLDYLPKELRKEAESLVNELGNAVNEIRLRVGRPAVASLSDGNRIIGKDRLVTTEMLNETLERMCDYSIYSYQKELAHGFITLPGGHRVGVCGTATSDKNGNRVIKYISSLNIRLAGEYKGCSDKLVTHLFSEKISGTFIAGPPCSGKTTLLKDLALKLSSMPYSYKTVIVDERNEIAAMYRGIPQNTVGMHCDVLSGYPKAEGIRNAVRSLSPDIVICDEIGGKDDSEALCDVINAGVVIISSVHACNVDELYRRENMRKILNSGAFERIVMLKGGSCRCEVDSITEVVYHGD